MEAKNLTYPLFILLILLLFTGGCGSGSANTYKNTSMNFGAIQSVAVLPLDNLSKDDDAAPRIRDTFMGMLQAAEAMYVLPPGEVRRGIERVQIRNPATPTVEEMKKLGEILQVEAVIVGTVKEYGPVRSGQSEANLISLSLQMMEVDTGTIVWSGSSTKGGISVADRLFGGGGEPMNKVTEKALNDLLDQLFL